MRGKLDTCQQIFPLTRTEDIYHERLKNMEPLMLLIRLYDSMKLMPSSAICFRSVRTEANHAENQAGPLVAVTTAGFGLSYILLMKKISSSTM